MVKNPPANAVDVGLVAGPGRSPGEGNINPLQCSCLGNPVYSPSSCKRRTQPSDRAHTWLLYNIVLVSAVQESESAVHIHIPPLFWISFPLKSPESNE